MKRSLQFRHVISRFTVAGCLAVAATCAVASESVPVLMQVPAGNYVAWRAAADGVVTYDCVQSQADTSKQVWTISSAKAKLGQEGDAQRGVYKSPPETWTAADGSSVTGMQVLRVPAGADRLNDQLVIANPANGAGLLSSVTYIQRLVQAGGAAPTAACDVASLGKRVDVPYQALYVFWNPN